MAKTEKTLEQLQAELEKAQKAYDDAKKLDEQKRAAAAELKRLELAKVKENRKKEVDDAINRAIDLLKTYIEDYGDYSFGEHLDDLSFLFGSKPWRFFL